MVINIASRDKRYILLNEMLKARGYESELVEGDGAKDADVLILAVRRELDDNALDELFGAISKKTVVLSGNAHLLSKRYGREVIDYTEGEEFLQKNAYLTAEACISYLHSLSGEALRGKKFFISGYGRIGKHLAKILCMFSEKIFIYARRQEVRAEIENDGFIPSSLDTACECDYVLNTVPYPIFSDTLISNIPKESYIVELASSSGFESTERVSFALGLPGKILPASAARVIYEAILPYLEKERKTP
jgi:dipicolinate synthase subunit A